MRVLLQNRPAELWTGGDQIQLEQIQKALVKKGIGADYNGQPVISPAFLMSQYDIVHLFNFSMLWTKYQLWVGKKWKKPVVCSMIYHESDAFIPYDQQQIMLDSLDAALFLAPGEVERVRRHLIIPDEKIFFVPNGIDPFWFNPVTVDEGVMQSGFILTVGRIEPSKGQLAVAKACIKLNVPYICIGDVVDNSYRALLDGLGAIILPRMGPEDLIKFYASCGVFCLASRAEVMPLSAMEAGAQGAPIVLTDHCEYKDIPGVHWVEFENVDKIVEKLRLALLGGKNLQWREQLRSMTWDKVADQLITIYEYFTI